MEKARGRLERLLDLSLVGRIFAVTQAPHQLPGRVDSSRLLLATC